MDMIGSGRAPRPALPRTLGRVLANAILAVALAAGTPSPGTPAAQAAGAPPAPSGGAWVAPPPPARAVGPRFQRGVCYAHIHRRGLGYGSDESRATLQRLKGLGVTWLSLTPFGYQRSVSSPEVIYRGDPSMRDSAFAREVRTIHALGMKAIIKPHIWAGDFWSGQWSGDIRMKKDADWDTWFRSYRAFILHFAALAAVSGADAFCIGCELGGTTRARPERWRSLITEVRKVYHGPLTYAANWHEEYEKVSFWDALDWIGVNAYFELSDDKTPTSFEIERAWRPITGKMAALSRRWGRALVLTEIGFRSVDNPARNTSAWPEFDQGRQVNAEAQRACYEGTFRALWGEPWLAGMYWWKYYSAPGGEGPEEADFTPAGKPAEGVLAKYYRGAR